MVLALLLLIYRTSHPHGAVVGQLPGTEAYRDIHRHPDALTFPGLMIWRAGGDLFFASIGHFNEGLKAVVAGVNPLQMKQGIEKAVEDITDKLKKMSIKIKDKSEMSNVATIAVRNGIIAASPVPVGLPPGLQTST